MWRPVAAQLVKLTAQLTNEPNGEALPLSDHFGVETTFGLVASKAASTHIQVAKPTKVLAQAHQLARAQARKTYQKRQCCWYRAYAALYALAGMLIWEACTCAHARSLQQLHPTLYLTLWVLLTQCAVLFFLYGHFVVGDELAAVKELAQQMRVQWQTEQRA